MASRCDSDAQLGIVGQVSRLVLCDAIIDTGTIVINERREIVAKEAAGNWGKEQVKNTRQWIGRFDWAPKKSKDHDQGKTKE